MKNIRTEQELKDGFKECFKDTLNLDDKLFKIFCKCVRWVDNHPTKSTQEWMDEVTLLHKEIQKLKENIIVRVNDAQHSES
jgi:hypothetical protein